MTRSGPRKDPNTPVVWEQVWDWCRDIEAKWGYHLCVTITQPIGSKKGDRFTVALVGEKLKVGDPSRCSSVTKWRTVHREGLTAEVVALQLAVELHQALDREDYAAERAALDAGAMF